MLILNTALILGIWDDKLVFTELNREAELNKTANRTDDG